MAADQRSGMGRTGELSTAMATGQTKAALPGNSSAIDALHNDNAAADGLAPPANDPINDTVSAHHSHAADVA